MHNEICFNSISLVEIPDDFNKPDNTIYELYFEIKKFKLKDKKLHNDVMFENTIFEIAKKLEFA